MKVCDAADWFDADFAGIVAADLQDMPRLHRKQWEFAAIYGRLRGAGVLHEGACGISFGAGRERLLYGLANRVGHLWATDLYDESTDWPDARTADIDSFVRGDPPIASRVDRLSARHMDMRQIEFPDETFDFAYSSSAVEHIGEWADFKAHLDEVRRVLKPGGVYVMTTDIIYGPGWHEPRNFKFDPDGLRWWLQESGMSYGPVVDCRIARHLANAPLPTDLATCITPDGGAGRPNLFERLLQVQMLIGCHPHSSVVLEMRKTAGDRPAVRFPGYAETKAFLTQDARIWQQFSENSHIAPHPAATVPAQLRDRHWATPYILLGGRPRWVVVQVQTDRPGHVTIGMNKAHTDSCWVPVVEIPERVEATTGQVEFAFPVTCDPDWIYAVYGNAVGDIALTNVSVHIHEAGFAATTPPIVRRAIVEEPPVSPEDALPPPVVAVPEMAPGTRTLLADEPTSPVVVPTPQRRHPLAGVAGMVNRLLRPIGVRIVRA